MSKPFYRHGDVILKPVNGLPDGKKKRRKDKVLAEGEVTGHKHVMVGEDVEVLEIEEGLYVRVTGDGVSIQHEEHATITLPKGTYQATIQREYSPEEIRNVVD